MPNNDYAGFWIRVAAGILDAITWLLPVNLLAFFLGYLVEEAVVVTVLGWLLSLMIAPVFAYFIHNYGTTPGGHWMEIETIDIRTERYLSSEKAFGRYILISVQGLAFSIPLIFVAFNSRKMGIHDYFCNTKVVYNRNRKWQKQPAAELPTLPPSP